MGLNGKSSDYDRVCKAIIFLREHRHQQPDLVTLSAQLGLSEFHVQKLFSRWAGISPKRFLQFLTVEFAKQQMAVTGDLLSLSHEVGLSGPGRLHDLFITLEAMSPGEFKNAAQGINICYGLGETPFGLALIATTDRGVCHLSFIDHSVCDQAIQQLKTAWPSAQFEVDHKIASTLLRKIFNPENIKLNKPVSLWVSGSNFQIQVWRALLQIPFSGLLSYQQLAKAMGIPKASRAVGNAIAQNPVAYLIPCHRVLRSSGEFGQYHWGENRKAALMVWEQGKAYNQGVEP